MIDSALLDRVTQSYGRCAASAGFWDRFYGNFLATSPEIAEMFRNTDMAKQKQLLNGSLNFVLLYAKHPDQQFVRAKLEQVGQIHDRDHVNVRPDLYPLWVNSLLQTVKEIEGPQFDAALEQAWRSVLQPAIEILKSMYVPVEAATATGSA